MRILALVLGLCLMSSLALADVTSEIIDVTPDNNGNIMVKTQYKIDGVEVVSRYPKFGGKHYFVTRYDCMNFKDMSKEQIKERILSDIKEHSRALIVKTYIKKSNTDILRDFPEIVGTTNREDIGSIIFDTDNDNEPDKEWVVKTNGEKTEKPYTRTVATDK